jgi:hypothetical protein
LTTDLTRLRLMASSLDPLPPPLKTTILPPTLSTAAWVAVVVVVGLAAILLGGCATPRRGAYCREWCEPLDLLAVYSDGTCVCSVGAARTATRAVPMPPAGQFGETTKIAPNATEVRP